MQSASHEEVNNSQVDGEQINAEISGELNLDANEESSHSVADHGNSHNAADHGNSP